MSVKKTKDEKVKNPVSEALVFVQLDGLYWGDWREALGLAACFYYFAWKQ